MAVGDLLMLSNLPQTTLALLHAHRLAVLVNSTLSQIPMPPRPRNSPTTINGRDYSGHAIDRMQERGFVPSVVENAIQTGTRTPGKPPGTTVCTNTVNNLRVIVDSATGRVVTVIPGG